jgi:putative membrane protein
MKKLSLIFFIAILIGSQACNGDVNNEERTTAPNETAQISVPIDRDDAQFAVQAANNGMADIELGRLAVKRGLDKRVKNFGAMMIKEQIKANSKLQAIAKNKKITLPEDIDADDRKVIDELDKKKGKDFDTAYLTEMTQDHEHNIKLFQTATTQLMDPDLRSFAAKNLLIYKRHLDAINGVKASI